MQLERPMGNGDGVRLVGVCERSMQRRLRAGRNAVLGQRRADVLDERPVGIDLGVYESGVRGWRLHRRVQSDREAMQRTHTADV
jgi:hypothetical protein